MTNLCCDYISTADPAYANNGSGVADPPGVFGRALQAAVDAQKPLLVATSLDAQRAVSITQHGANPLKSGDVVSIKGCGPDTVVTFDSTAVTGLSITAADVAGAHTARFTYSASTQTKYIDYGYASELLEDAYPDTYTVRLKDVSAFTAGQLIKLRSCRLCEGENRAADTHGETNRVVKVVKDADPAISGTVTVELPLRDAYSSVDTTWTVYAAATQPAVGTASVTVASTTLSFKGDIESSGTVLRITDTYPTAGGTLPILPVGANVTGGTVSGTYVKEVLGSDRYLLSVTNTNTGVLTYGANYGTATVASFAMTQPLKAGNYFLGGAISAASIIRSLGSVANTYIVSVAQTVSSAISVAVYDLRRITLASTTAAMDPRFVRGCRTYIGSGQDDFRYVDSYDADTLTLSFDNLTTRNNNYWEAFPATTTAITIGAKTFASAAASPSVRIEDIVFAGQASGQTTGVYILNAHDVRFDKVGTRGWASTGKQFDYCVRVLVDDCQDEQSGAYRNNGPVSFVSCNEAEWRNSRAFNFWQPGDTNADYYGHQYRYRNITLVSGYGYDGHSWVDHEVTDFYDLTYGMTTHGPILDILYDGCISDNMNFPIQQRGVRETYRNCAFAYPGHWYGVALNGGHSIRIENCTFTDRYGLETWPRPSSEAAAQPWMLVRAPLWWGDIHIDGLHGELRGPLITISPEDQTGPILKVRGRITARNLTGLRIRPVSGDVQLVSCSVGPYLGDYSQAGSQAGFVVERGLALQVDPGDVTVTGGGKLIIDPRAIASRRVGYGRPAEPSLVVGAADIGAFGYAKSLNFVASGRETGSITKARTRLNTTPNVPLRGYVNSNAWLIGTSTGSKTWNGVCWSSELGLFCAVGTGSSNNRIMTSVDGATWISATAPNIGWQAVVWAPELGLFCAIANSGTTTQVATSPAGVDVASASSWTLRTTAANETWTGLCWSPELGLFCAVASSSTTSQVMTSPDGVTWTAGVSAANLTWNGVCWSSGLGLFCAVANAGGVMTSPDGLSWTSRTAASSNDWKAVTWSPELGLFCAVASSGTGTRVMTSPDGVVWTTQASAVDNSWTSVAWSPDLGLFTAVASTGTGNQVMTSPDGKAWATRTTPATTQQWSGVCWSPELGIFGSVSKDGTVRAMTSKSMYGGFTYR